MCRTPTVLPPIASASSAAPCPHRSRFILRGGGIADCLHHYYCLLQVDHFAARVAQIASHTLANHLRDILWSSAFSRGYCSADKSERSILVSTAPGAIVCTRMPALAPSRAADNPNRLIPALAGRTPRNPETDRRRLRGNVDNHSAALPRKDFPNRPAQIECRRQIRIDDRARFLVRHFRDRSRRATPAQCTTASTRPYDSIARATIVSAACGFATSTCTTIPLPASRAVSSS